MTDIFFSYSSADRERVRPIRDALVAQGFEVFWDQQVPGGTDWDTWIRQHLAKSKCAMAFWSATSVLSDNVRHEATVAKQQGKLISVLLEPLTAEQFPMGLYTQQAANFQTGMVIAAMRSGANSVAIAKTSSRRPGCGGNLTKWRRSWWASAHGVREPNVATR